jgi:putative ABC transport system ATP-binding protein
MMIEIIDVCKRYYSNNKLFNALDGISLTVEKGDYLSVTGPSGAGKSTLLYLIGGLIQPDSGSILFNGSDLYQQPREARDSYRKKKVGFVFQQFHLMPYLSVIENIRLACYENSHLENINALLEKCSLTELKDKYPSELSVGEKQRVAFIRAIISSPELLLADEPTGNLDPGNSEMIMDLIGEFHKRGGTVIVVSHNPDISKHSDKVLTLEKGNISSLKSSINY